MKLTIPDKSLLKVTGPVDYFNWNYKFPIKYIQRYRFKRIVKLLGKMKYPKLLEIGTGSGIFIPELAKHCDKIYACDIHSEFDHIDLLCKHYNIQNYDLSTQNIESTNYPSNEFDVVAAVSVLRFVSGPSKALNEIKRILKKDGIFITILPMENRVLDFFLSFYTSKGSRVKVVTSSKNVSKLLESNFRVIEKGYMIPIIGKIFPVYTHYKLKNI